MYRIGTGDCFLLKFRSGNEVTFTMLIDCGSCRGDSATFTGFVREIAADVNNHLGLLVITHEHLDHIIGFARAQDVFKQIQIDHVWVAWTEEPGNALAEKLKAQYGKEVQALTKAVQRTRSLTTAFTGQCR
jgi:glyoxylase-like metal-dependent hydrolase (beta-lactamase superfamily II)